jgi:hypothetical protein
MLPGPGRNLDQMVARALGEDGKAPPYSTDAAAADSLKTRLEQGGISLSFETAGQQSYCTLWVEIGWVRERMATGSGPTPEMALCRAVVNLPTGRRLPPGHAIGATSLTPTRVQSAASGRCITCDRALPIGESAGQCSECARLPAPVAAHLAKARRGRKQPPR